MNATYTVTVTSKNQITLPAELVRRWGLAKRRQLTIDMRDDAATMQPRLTTSEALQQFRDENRARMQRKTAPTDQELRTAAQEIAAKRASR